MYQPASAQLVHGEVCYGSTGSVPCPTYGAQAETMLKKKASVNLFAVLVSIIGPIGMFVVVLCVLSLSIRRSCFAVVIITMSVLGCILAACLYLAFVTTWRRWHEQTVKDPFWYLFIAAAMTVAWAAGFWQGEANWLDNVSPYLELGSMDSRFDVDPATAVGQQFMDTGVVTFTKGTALNLSQSMGFKNVEQYCVAPIVHGGARPVSYDFWAVGLNCCSGGTADFHCENYDNPNATAGVRVMRQDERAFFRLAVQQAEATYDLEAFHPLFFYWVQDPQAEIDAHKEQAVQNCIWWSLTFGAFEVVVVIFATVTHAKL